MNDMIDMNGRVMTASCYKSTFLSSAAEISPVGDPGVM